MPHPLPPPPPREMKQGCHFNQGERRVVGFYSKQKQALTQRGGGAAGVFGKTSRAGRGLGGGGGGAASLISNRYVRAVSCFLLALSQQQNAAS